MQQPQLRSYYLKKTYLLLLACSLMVVSCDKEPRKVDLNNGNENPSARKLIIETTHRYSNTADSVLPNVSISLFETEDDVILNKYTRSDTTDNQGKLTFQNMSSGSFIVVLGHKTLGTKRERVNITNETVVSYEYFYY